MSEPHWLLRLDPAGWLRAAAHELAQADAKRGARKTALVHARRGAGMALNAVLLATAGAQPPAEVEARWGRSYVEHLQALVAGRHEPLPALAIELARRVLAPALTAPELVVLGGTRGADVGDAIAAAHELVASCRAVAAPV